MIVVIRMAVFLLALVCVNSTVVWAEQLRAGYAALNGSQLPLWVAKDQGIYSKHGLDVELLYLQGGSLNVQAIVAGTVQFGAGGAGAVAARMAGVKLLIIANPGPFLSQDLIAKPGIKTITDLKGKVGAVARLGGSGEQAFRYLFRKHGLSLSDLKLIQTGADQAKLAVLQQGIVDYTSVGPAASQQARAQGYTVLGTAEQMRIPFPWTSVVVSESWLSSNRDAAYRYVKAITEASWFIKRNREKTLQVLGKYMRISDPRLLSMEYDFNIGLIPDLPFPTVEGIRVVLENLTTSGGAAQRNPQEFIDSSIVERIQREKFLDSLKK